MTQAGAQRLKGLAATAQVTPMVKPPAGYKAIHGDIVELLQAARVAAARSVNALMTVSYWEIGRRIVAAEQQGRRKAGYGDALIKQLALDLTHQFGRGFGWRNLFQMRAFYLAWPEILQTPSAISDEDTLLKVTAPHFPLPWSAYVRLLSVKNEQARQFYERTALSRNKAAMLTKAAVAKPEDAVTPEEAIKDPFVLEFLALKDEYSETQLEEALIHRLEDFLLELGDDFAFVGRQKRLRLDDSWFRVDLVFFHRTLRCLVIVDLKVGKFSYTDAGQMHMYLNYAKAQWMREGENPPVGLILCSQKGTAEAHYALDGLPNKVLAAQYQTVLPSEAEIAKALEQTTRMLASRNVGGGKSA